NGARILRAPIPPGFGQKLQQPRDSAPRTGQGNRGRSLVPARTGAARETGRRTAGTAPPPHSGRLLQQPGTPDRESADSVDRIERDAPQGARDPRKAGRRVPTRARIPARLGSQSQQPRYSARAVAELVRLGGRAAEGAGYSRETGRRIPLRTRIPSGSGRDSLQPRGSPAQTRQPGQALQGRRNLPESSRRPRETGRRISRGAPIPPGTGDQLQQSGP